jgi:hypothetical protein
MNNLIVKILENKEKERKNNVVEWGVLNRNRLVKILEKSGASITNNVYDSLLFNINGLRIGQSGKICYLSFYPKNKKIMTLFLRYEKEIKENFNYIVSNV